MFLIDRILFVAGLLLLLSILSSKFSTRVGVPVLVLFLALGMLAGSEGIGGIAFENYGLAHAIGTAALALILFDGGLRTPFASVRLAWRPSASLATLGVLITSLITGLAAAVLLDLPWLHGMLLGSIVGSTDAAAIFAVLRSGGISLSRRLASILEIESGSNDPMAIFLTVGLIELVLGQANFGAGLLVLFLQQMLIGAVVGLAVGKLATLCVNHINLASAGLYPILATAAGLLAYGSAASLGGSGFLSVYLAGMLIGNSRIVLKRGIFLFHDGLAWLGQIAMFVMLGLLSFPSQLFEVAVPALGVATVLILVARPAAVFASLLPFRMPTREVTFVAWGGLKGAVPITLATFPLLLGVEGAMMMFNVVFFVVVVSALVQGWSLPACARWLGLERPPASEPPVSLEISSLRHVEGDIVDYFVGLDSRAAHRSVRDLPLPDDVVIAMITRGQHIVMPRGHTIIEPGDHVIVVLTPQNRHFVDRVFAPHLPGQSEDMPLESEFPLRGSVTMKTIRDLYCPDLDIPIEWTIDETIRRRLNSDPISLGSTLRTKDLAFHVREMDRDGRITRVGMVVCPRSSEKSPPDSSQSSESTPDSADAGPMAASAATTTSTPDESASTETETEARHESSPHRTPDASGND
ncbi:K(+)/H(+) antiporter NhaP [Maioricimonas rarisocia]|uniref:K(+)/H(+) antiporter NhaP n=1 Tax=Maioricimonas rarisocia TaxID=2528026 RepID=A0A517ZDS9_9PLAN|nr:potassium/proton antiporter [Maioricimonas rarisocia]QDU40600.1 K(+)/H(+) antiporter NhaP [Maioricimonas rarisocia]